jgi:hypothetical protein
MTMSNFVLFLPKVPAHLVAMTGWTDALSDGTAGLRGDDCTLVSGMNPNQSHSTIRRESGG